MRIMLTIYRRHIPCCAHAEKGRAFTRCKCPIWIDGQKEGERLNYSLKTRNWTKASQQLLKIEVGEADPEKKLKPIDKAAEQYLAKLTSEGMAAATIKKYRARLLGTFTVNRERRAEQYTMPLASAAAQAGKKFVQNIDLEFLEAYRSTWTGGPLTAAKRIEGLRSFFRWCVSHGWLKSNPAKDLRMPVERVAPKLPYSREDVASLLQACGQAPRKESQLIRDNRQRLKSLILVARFSGLRISDACMLTAAKVEGGRVMLYMAKTGVPVFVPLPAFVMAELDRTPFRSGAYWFWNGESSVEATADVWRDRLGRMAKRANVANPEWHRFRDTFAVELLLQGVPIERVAALLGHQSIQITEKHYAPWVRARQAQLEADVAAAWTKDPTAQVLSLLQAGDIRKEEVRN